MWLGEGKKEGVAVFWVNLGSKRSTAGPSDLCNLVVMHLRLSRLSIWCCAFEIIGVR